MIDPTISIEVMGAITVQDHANKRHKFLTKSSENRFDDLNHLMEELIKNYDHLPWLPNNKEDERM